MEIVSASLAVAAVSLLAAISPGPDFVVVLRNSLVHSRKAGLLTALGVSIALFVHLFYTLVGIGVLIAESPLFYTLLKYTGVAYLFYIGLKGVISSFKKVPALQIDCSMASGGLSSSAAFMQGFWTNLLNPKCALFFISLFSQFIDSDTPVVVRIEYAFINWSVTLGWFLFLAYMITGKQMLGKVDYFRAYIDRVMGGALMFLGVKLLLV